MKAPKTVYICSECAYKSPKWLGKCPNCDAWNSFEEETEMPAPDPKNAKRVSHIVNSRASGYNELDEAPYERTRTGFSELDRVLGGGLVDGSVVLISGEPGIGKSTLLMQITDTLGDNKKVLYVSGEESGGQLRLRGKRLGISGNNLSVLTETNIDSILSEADRIHPDIIIADSIQTIYSVNSASSAGSVTQVRECAFAFIEKAKSSGLSVLLVGHVNKEGGIAGPKVLEHMVDAVLYFEGERQQSYRIIRAVKNRFGSTNEIGVFEMTEKGLCEVPNPSEMLLAGRPKDTPGNCAVCTLEGTRPIIAEIQALVTPTPYPAPRRNANGIEYNRMCLILAVLEKRLGMRFSANDIYMNVIGGLRLDEPASDLASAMSLISSLADRAVPDDMIVMGELGLSGECRAISNIELRLREAVRLGFTKAVIPYRNTERRAIDVEGLELLPVKSVFEIIKLLKKPEKNTNRT